MAAGSTYTPIATQTLGSTQATVIFSSIPSTYTDLVFSIQAAGTPAGNDIRIRFNGDSTGGNYSSTILTGDGSTAQSAVENGATVSSILTDYYSGTSTTLNGMHIVNIQNYANTTTYKTTLSRASRASSGVDAVVGLWRSTAAINSVTFIIASNSYAAGSTFNLYGILAA